MREIQLNDLLAEQIMNDFDPVMKHQHNITPGRVGEIKLMQDKQSESTAVITETTNSRPTVTTNKSTIKTKEYLFSLSSLHLKENMNINNTNQSLNKIKLEDLTLCQHLGEGGFGDVTLVLHNTTKNRYAMKKISKQHLIQKRQTEEAIRETKIMSSLNHPFVTNLISTFQDRNNIYMIIDLVRGGDLFDVIFSRNIQPGCHGISYNSAQFYAACVFESLAHIHSRGIVYRDLKPENCLVDGSGYCILGDFGFAKRIVTEDDDNDNNSNNNKTFTVCGTLAYMAPELIRGTGYGTSVDIWGLGVLVYEMLVGSTPFISFGRHDTPQSKVLDRIVRGKFKFPKNEKLSFACKDFISKLLTMDPSDRIGCSLSGEAEIKDHDFFYSVDWTKLTEKKIKAPWLPPIIDELSCGFSMDSKKEEIEYYLSEEDQALFKDFGLR